MIIPYQQIDGSVLLRIIEDFVGREGTDYGEVELSLEQKASQLLAQIKSCNVYVSYDEAEETVSLLTKEDAQNLGLLD